MARHIAETSDSGFLSSARKPRKADLARKFRAPAMVLRRSLGEASPGGASSTKQSEQKAITPPDLGIHPDSWIVPYIELLDGG